MFVSVKHTQCERFYTATLSTVKLTLAGSFDFKEAAENINQAMYDLAVCSQKFPT
jgi:hypothetical protein